MRLPKVVAGNIGCADRVKYGVVGSPVNLTSRLESLTIGSQVLISRATRELVADQVDVRGPLKAVVKGREQPLVYFELLGISDDPELRLEPLDDVTVAMKLRTRVTLLRGKRLSTTQREAEVRRLGSRRIEIAPRLDLDEGDNVKLQIRFDDDWSGPIYAKVVTVLDSTRDDPDGVELAFTSVERTDQSRIEALLDE